MMCISQMQQVLKVFESKCLWVYVFFRVCFHPENCKRRMQMGPFKVVEHISVKAERSSVKELNETAPTA